MALMAHAQIEITTPGDYLFRTDSDDGFRVLIPGKNFTHVSGGGLAVFQEGLGWSSSVVVERQQRSAG